MVPADSCRISRAPHYSGSRLRVYAVFGYRPVTFFGSVFQHFLLTGRCRVIGGPTTPTIALLQCRFGLLRVRSPLLAQSLLFSLPPGTEMFQFPGLAPVIDRWRALQRVGLPHSDIRGYGGYLPLTAAFRSLSRPSSPPRAKASFMCPSLLSFFFSMESRL